MDESQVFKSAQTRRAEEWLLHLKKTTQAGGAGRLKVFLGMSAGVGKTFAMLKAAQAEQAVGRDVVIGLVETHGRKETEDECAGIPVLPRKKFAYQGTELEELDLDGVLARRPGLVLVDELAHTNAPGSRHPKRYQDVQELLTAGLDVFTTLNVQHLESRADAVASITGVPVRETVPDGVLDQAVEIQLIDLSPEKLLQRLREGRVYLGDRKEAAIKNFFKTEHLTALRELALRATAERVDQDLLAYRKSTGDERPWQTTDRLLVAIGPNPQGEHLLRASRRLAHQMGAVWIAAYVKDGSRLSLDEERFLERNLSLARELGAEVVIRDDPDKVEGLLRTARERNVSQVLLGKPEGSFAFSLRSRWLEHLFARAGGIQISFVPTSSDRRRPILPTRIKLVTGPRRHYGYAAIVLVASILLGFALESSLGYFGIGLLLLSIVFAAGLVLAPGSVIALSVFQAFSWNFFFIEPRYTPWIGKPADLALCLIFVVAAVTLGSATARLRLREERYRRGELEALAQADLLSLVRDTQEEPVLIREAVALLGRYFRAQATVLFMEPNGRVSGKPAIETTYQPGEKELAVAKWSIEQGKEAGRWTDTLRDSEVWCCPIRTSKQTLGTWMIQARESSLSSSEREAIRSLVSSLALGIERLRLSRLDQEAELARESNRLQKILLNSVSHEIRTPLTTVIGNLELWLDRNESSREIQTSLSEAREVDRILEELVSLNRLENPSVDLRLDWMDLEELVEGEIRRIRQRYPEALVEAKLGGGLTLLRSDPRILSMVVRNLLDNAVKHTPQGTRVRIRWRKSERFAELWIEDSGQGVPETIRDQIFDRFFRGDAAQSLRGLGLGLSIAQGFMKALRGGIRCETSPLGGAAFVLSFSLESVRENASELPEERA